MPDALGENYQHLNEQCLPYSLLYFKKEAAINY